MFAERRERGRWDCVGLEATHPEVLTHFGSCIDCRRAKREDPGAFVFHLFFAQANGFPIAVCVPHGCSFVCDKGTLTGSEIRPVCGFVAVEADRFNDCESCSYAGRVDHRLTQCAFCECCSHWDRQAI
jgi:hypothetical protein